MRTNRKGQKNTTERYFFHFSRDDFLQLVAVSTYLPVPGIGWADREDLDPQLSEGLQLDTGTTGWVRGDHRPMTDAVAG